MTDTLSRPRRAALESASDKPAVVHGSDILVLLGIVSFTCAGIIASAVLQAPPATYPWLLFVHLACASTVLVVGTVDWYGLLAVRGRIGLVEALWHADRCAPLIWFGLLGLVATGAWLSPDLSHPVTLFKMAAVLAVGLVGVLARLVKRALHNNPASRSLLTVGAVLAGFSQFCWWSAFIVGFLTSQAR